MRRMKLILEIIYANEAGPQTGKAGKVLRHSVALGSALPL
jgi:hypothetical protein